MRQDYIKQFAICWMLLYPMVFIYGQCNFNVDAGLDTNFCLPTTYQLNANVSGTIVNPPTYQWTPMTGLNNPTIANPTAAVNTTTTYVVTASMLENTNLVQNGDFSSGNTGFSSNYTVGTGGTWGQLSLEGTYAITTNSNLVHNNFVNCSDHTGGGNMMVVNGASTANQDVWCQTLFVTPNTNYNFSAWVMSTVGSNPAILQFSINGILLGNPFTASSSTCQWQQFFSTWNSGTSTIASICIVNQNTAVSGNDFGLDDIALTPICVATDTVTVSIGNSVVSTVTASICPGETYFAGGQFQNTAGTYTDTIMASTGCDSILITNLSIENVAVDLGSDTAFCDGNTLLLDATNTNATYTWQDNTSNSTFTASTSGLYHVDVTVGSCTIRDSINVTVHPNPMVNLGNDTSFCDVPNVVLDATQPNASYLWQDNSTNSIFTAMQSGNYAVTITDNNNCIGQDDINLTFGNHPMVDLGNDTAICDGNTIILDVTNPNATYTWQDNSTNPTLTVTSNGTYFVDVAIAHCTVSDTLQVTLHPNPTVDLGMDTALCDAASFILDATTPNVNYQWQDNSTNSTLTVTQSGNYAVTITDNNGCTAQDDINLILGQSPTSVLGFDTIICENTTLLLDATTSNASYLWQDNSTNSTFLVSTSGLYKVIITLGNCSIEDSIQVTVANNPTVSIGTDTTLCDALDFTLDATTPNMTYQWQDNSTNPMFTATQSGTYTVTITDINGCTGSDAVNLNFSQSPPVNLGNDTTYCNNPTVTLDATTNGGISYVWQDGSTSPMLSLNTAGNYGVTVTNADNCAATDDINISGASYLWQDSSTNSTFTVTNAGLYQVTVTHPAGCNTSDSIQIDFAPPLDAINLPTDTTICEGQSVTFNAYQPNATAYEWIGESAFFGQNDLSDTSFSARFTGNYAVTVRNGCDAISHTITLLVEDCSCTPYIPNAFSPNNDGVNDIFSVLSGCPIENFSMQLFDRWGNRLFESTDITVGWDGTFRGQRLDSNIYVWRISYDATNNTGQVVNTVLTGDITLMR